MSAYDRAVFYVIGRLIRGTRYRLAPMEIQPKTFGDLLNEWFRSLGRNWKPLMMASLMAQGPLAIVVGFIFLVNGSTDAFALYLDPEAVDAMTEAELLEIMTPLLWTFAIWMLLQAVAGAFLYLASARTVAGDVSESGFSWRDVCRFAGSRTITAMAAVIVVLVASTLLLALAVSVAWALISALGPVFLAVFVTTTVALTVLVLLLWLGTSVSMTTPAIAMEDTGPVMALTRSFTLVQGRWWATLGFVLIAVIIVSAASQIAGLVLLPFFLVGIGVPQAMALGFAGSVLLQGPLLAATGAAYAIWYVDLRARREPTVAQQLI